MIQAATAQAQKQLLQARVRLVVRLTIAYNVLEAIIALVASKHADSAALLGFGLDSLVEVGSAAAVAWQFAGPDPEKREPFAIKMIAGSFFGLALLVTVDAVCQLFGAGAAEHSPVGIALAVLSVLIMPAFSGWEYSLGKKMGSQSVMRDSRQTLLCSMLSLVVLVGLVANLVAGWSWADPVAALVIAAWAIKEGWEAWQGDPCCSAGSCCDE